MGVVAGAEAAPLSPRPAYAVVSAQDEASAREAWRVTDEGVSHYLPLIEQDGVVAVAEVAAESGSTLAFLRGYDVATGEVAWDFDLDQFDEPVTSLPYVEGGLILLEGTSGDEQTLYAISPSTGDLAWEFPAGESEYFFVMGSTEDTIVFNVRGFASGVVRFYAVDRESGEVVWENEAEGVISGQLTDPERGVTYLQLRGMDEELTEQIVAMDVATGETLWSAPGGDFERTVYLTHVTSGAVVLTEATEEPYTLIVLDPESGETMWEMELPEQTGTRTVTTRATDDAVLLIVSEDGETTVTAMGAATGDEAWEAEMDGEVASGVILSAEGQLLVPLTTADGDAIGVAAIDVATGETTWSAEQETMNAIWYEAGTLYVTAFEDDASTVTAYEAAFGDELWTDEVAEELPLEPVGASEDVLYVQVGDEDELTLIALDAE